MGDSWTDRVMAIEEFVGFAAPRRGSCGRCEVLNISHSSKRKKAGAVRKQLFYLESPNED